jgi:tetratricopeptide (TPR) repeat protein
LHDLLRLFAREMAGAAPDQQALYRAVWFYARSAQLAWRRIRPLCGPELAASPLVRAAVAQCSSKEEALRWQAEASPSLREIALALPSLTAVPAAVGVAVLQCLVNGDGVAGSFRDTLAVSGRVVEHAIASGDPLARLVAHRLMAVNLQRLGRFREAKEAVAPAMALLSVVDDPVERIMFWNTVGIFQTEWGDHADAERSLRSGLDLAREHGQGSWISLLLHSLGMHYRVCGQLSLAIPLLREALDVRLSLHDEIGEMYTRMQLGKALGAKGEVARGLEHFDAAQRSAEKMDSDELVREIRTGRMEVLSHAGRSGDASAELRAALEVCGRLNDEALTAEVLREAERLSIA